MATAEQRHEAYKRSVENGKREQYRISEAIKRLTKAGYTVIAPVEKGGQNVTENPHSK